MQIYELTSGLGDCLIAGAALQQLNKPLYYKTNPLIANLFRYHPNIQFTPSGTPDFTFKWVSQLPNKKDLYSLHTMQRFSSQLGFYIDPTETLKIHNNEGQPIYNNRSSDVVAINQYSNEKDRRYLPDDLLDFLLDNIASNFNVVYIGSNKKNSITNIDEITSILSTCKLFIGPVSFCYHLAACLRCPSLLFTGYMPEHKFSHFVKTTTIKSKASCQFTCEKDRAACLDPCGAMEYNTNIILPNLQNLLYCGE